MVEDRDTCTLDEFRAHAVEHLDRLSATNRVESLTVDGKPKGVVVPADLFDKLLEHIETLETAASIQRGLADVAAGRTHDAREAIAEMRAKLRSLPVPNES